HGDPEVKVHRLSFGFDYVDDQFSEATPSDFEDVDVDPNSVSRDPALLAQDRRFSSPFVSYQSIEPDYVSLNYINRFERVEDFNLGQQLYLKLGLAPEAFGSLDDTLLLSSAVSHGWRFSSDSFVRGEILGETRFEGDWSNSIIGTQWNYYNILTRRDDPDNIFGQHTLAGFFKVDYSSKLDRDREFLLGASEGLRGYKSGTFTGDKRVIMNVEDRFHLLDDIFQLVSLGGAVFFDAGGTTTSRIDDIFEDSFYSDIGLGLRFNFPRSSGARVLRIDFAFPLRDGLDGSNAFELRVILEGGQAFS
ncbi:MAG: BamA/TamA family outer membrane protein, partial [Bdellovibrionales bacterium]|nr:BamA/TamA family outer membrane protein [Bdellovibrionales bacterium]